MKNRKHRYLCGYLRDGNCLYGRPRNAVQGSIKMRNPIWVDPMTLYQAKRYANKTNKQFRLTREKDKMQVFEIKVVKNI